MTDDKTRLPGDLLGQGRPGQPAVGRIRKAVADQVPDTLLNQGLLYPLQSNILETEINTAARVAKLVFDNGLARVDQPPDMEAFIRGHVYTPEYHKLA